MKKFTLLAIFMLALAGTQAQEQGKVRFGLDLGYAIPKGGGGIAFAADLKYTITDQMNAGIRWSTALLAKEVNNEKGSISGNASYLGVFNYHLNNGENSFAPYAGIGLGLYSLASVEVSSSNISASAGSKFGGMLGVGFELGKFKLGLEYHLIPKTAAHTLDVNGIIINNYKISNSYFTVTIGFYIGGGKWSK